MIVDVTFSKKDCGFTPTFGEVQTAGGGSYEQGVADGQKAEYDRLWNKLQRNNEEYLYYGYAFANRDLWTQENLEMIKHKNLKANYVSVVFINNSSITDLSAFSFDLGLNEFGEKTRATYSNTFGYCSNLVKCMTIDFDTVMSCPNMFAGCSSLVDLPVTGTLSVNGFSVAESPKLSHESLIGIINALRNNADTGVTNTITFGAENLAKLSDAEKAIATGKGWTMA